MYLHGNRSKDRVWAIAGVVAVHGLLAYALLSGLAMRVSERASDSLKLVDIVLPEPPPPPPPPEESSKPKGEPSPPNLKAVPTPVVAPPPRIPVPSPIAAAPVPSTGSAPTAGASSIAGPGTGAGGAGSGLGGGSMGGGGGSGAQRLRGQLNDSDYPIGAKLAGAQGRVAVRFTIQPDGRVSGCRIVKSSGNSELDGTTCRLIERRFRYRPARDAQGRPIAEVATTSFTWGLNRRR